MNDVDARVVTDIHTHTVELECVCVMGVVRSDPHALEISTSVSVLNVSVFFRKICKGGGGKSGTI